MKAEMIINSNIHFIRDALCTLDALELQIDDCELPPGHHTDIDYALQNMRRLLNKELRKLEGVE